MTARHHATAAAAAAISPRLRCYCPGHIHFQPARVATCPRSTAGGRSRRGRAGHLVSVGFGSGIGLGPGLGLALGLGLARRSSPPSAALAATQCPPRGAGAGAAAPPTSCSCCHACRPCCTVVSSACTAEWQPVRPQPPTVNTEEPIHAPETCSAAGGGRPTIDGRSHTSAPSSRGG